MKLADLPRLIEPEQLEPLLADGNLLVVDLSSRDNYARLHIPGAVHLDYPLIVAGTRPAPGLLPPMALLARVLGALGLRRDHHVVATDDEGNGKSARLLWTLDVLGHPRWSLLNGGMHAWANEGHRLDGRAVQPTPAPYAVHYGDGPVATRDWILAHLDDPGTAILDARSAEEFSGQTVRAARGGHIPGAVNLDWLETMDRTRNLRLKPAEELREMLAARGLLPDRTIVCHCQTHHRSAHSYVMLRSLGYPDVKGYPGSWAEWGNDPETPIET